MSTLDIEQRLGSMTGTDFARLIVGYGFPIATVLVAFKTGGSGVLLAIPLVFVGKWISHGTLEAAPMTALEYGALLWSIARKIFVPAIVAGLLILSVILGRSFAVPLCWAAAAAVLVVALLVSYNAVRNAEKEDADSLKARERFVKFFGYLNLDPELLNSVKVTGTGDQAAFTPVPDEVFTVFSNPTPVTLKFLATAQMSIAEITRESLLFMFSAPAESNEPVHSAPQKTTTKTSGFTPLTEGELFA